MLKTATEMAKILRCSEKTFNKRVREFALPFIQSGQRLFDETKVLSMLETVETVREVKVKSKGKGLSLNNKYREMLGI